jgi:glycosyltransferase involved in cell wall biosynthesis
MGVGGAMISGYRLALTKGANILIKIDGDGQMDPNLIPKFIHPIIDGMADYTKGNRFYDLSSLKSMPPARLFGNAVLSFLNKISSGYWNLFDPTNGYTAIHAKLLNRIPFEKISKRYFFESDMLFRLNLLRAKVVDVPMMALYGNEVSGLKITKIIVPFAFGHLKNLLKRIFYNYYLRDFNFASISLAIGLFSLLFGINIGLYSWYMSVKTGVMATSGTVMLATLPIILGFQLVLFFLSYDISSIPSKAIHKDLN